MVIPTALMLGRSGSPVSWVMAMEFKDTGSSNLMATAWPRDIPIPDATHAVDGSPSNAEAGPSEGSSSKALDPEDVADTDLAPIGAATVWESVADGTT